MRLKAQIETLARTPGMLRNLADEYDADNFEPRDRVRAFKSRLLTAVLREVLTDTPPYPPGSDDRRHWIDGWNWFVRGATRAQATKSYWAGERAASDAKQAGRPVHEREDF